MRIAFTGTCSTGKTSLGEALITHHRTLGLASRLVSADARSILRAFGHTSLDKLSDLDLCAFQLQYFVKKLEEEEDLQNYITDRSFLDIAAYWIVRNGQALQESERMYLVHQCRRASARYDLHIYLPFGVIPFVEDGYRATDRAVEERIDKQIRSLLVDWKLRYVTVTKTGIQERVEEVLTAIGELA